jgi:Uma2 family endonuclease
MTVTTLSNPIITTSLCEQIRPLAEHRVILHDVSWLTFENLLADVGDRRKTLFHYLNGTLEIMSPLSLHVCAEAFNFRRKWNLKGISEMGTD